MKELLIVGSGPIGLYAAFSAGLRKIDAFVLESSQTVGGQLNLYGEKHIYDIPGFISIKASELSDVLYKQYETYKNQIPIQLNETLISINKKDNYYNVVTNIATYDVKKILLTHGGGKFMPRGIEGLEAKNLDYAVYDLNRYKDKDVVILGGGDSAVDWANIIKDIAKSVSLIHRRTEFRAHLASLEIFKEKGGIIYTPYILKDQQIENNYIKELTILNVNTNELVNVKTDEVLIFYGLIQTKSSYEDWLVHAENGLILVNTKMETSVDGIYACGNGVYYEGKQKMITSGFGEVVQAICAINLELHPEQKVPQYSSLMKK
ncbi:MAG: NAD(P)/FAD-dependent oxidoreductase [Acholeplasmataceae bacterium]